MRRVVITGMGVLNSLGQGVPSVWNRLIAGDNGISKITLFNATHYKCKVAAEVREVDGVGLEQRDCSSFPSPVTSVSAREMRRATSIFLACAKEAFAASGMAQSGFDADSVGVSAGASVAF